MKKRRPMTAAEFGAQWQSDEAAVARERAYRESLEARHEQARVARQPLMKALHGAGYFVTDLDDFREKHTPVQEDAVDILLAHLLEVGDPLVQDSIVRTLALSEVQFPGVALAQLFESSESDGLRWVIANTIAEARPVGLEGWIVDTLADQRYGKAREMLVIAAARLLPRDEALAVIVPRLDELPLHAAKAIAEIGGAEQIPLLEERMSTAGGLVRKEFERAIRKVRARLRKNEGM